MSLACIDCSLFYATRAAIGQIETRSSIDLKSVQRIELPIGSLLVQRRREEFTSSEYFSNGRLQVARESPLGNVP